MHHASQHRADRDVEDRADDQAAHDADRHVPLRVLRFLRRGRNGIEPDVGEEDDPGGLHHAAPAELPEAARVLGDERLPVGAVDGPHAEPDEQHDDCDLDRDHDRIEACGLVDADIAQRRDGGDHKHRRQVQDGPGAHDLEVARPLGERRVRQCVRQVHAELLDEAHDVAGPADRDRGRGEQVLEDQVPADEPGDEFAERGVRIRVSAARHGDHRGELRVAESGERAAEAGDQERHDERGSGVVRRSRARQHEDAGADDGADAQQDEGARVERAVELVRGVGLVQFADRFGREQRMHGSCRVLVPDGQCRRTLPGK